MDLGILGISIETTTTCNRRCSYCPNAYVSRGDHFMEERLFKKIIQELQEANYRETIALHLYGEPLTDSRIVDWIRHTRNALPEAKIPFFSNGELLTEDKIDLLISAGVDKFIISLHHQSQISYMVLKKLEQLPTSQREIVSYTGAMDWLRNRGGFLSRRSSIQFQRTAPCYGCYYPVINYKGDFLLCCDDYLGSHPFGNLNDQTLSSIIVSQDYCRIRKKLFNMAAIQQYELETGRQDYLDVAKLRLCELDICRRCNAGGFSSQYSPA